ncbi:MAG: flagellar export protein FliJ [Pirellulales bacterium]|nr:flagellar export protein FliJ [Pirellulales bacterium]
MARFRFRLQTLLHLREAARDERRTALGEALAAEAVLLERRAEIDAQLQAQHELAQTRGLGPLDVDALLNIERYEMLLRAERQLLEKQLRSVQEEIEVRRAALAEADRQVRILERLRETQQDRFEHEARRLEHLQLDEVAAQRWLREARS